MKERGLSGSVQTALLLPLALSTLLGALQWAMVAWADATAVAAVEETLLEAAGREGTLGAARRAGEAVLSNGSLDAARVEVTRSGDRVVAKVTGRANFVVWPVPIQHSGQRVVERVQ